MEDRSGKMKFLDGSFDDDELPIGSLFKNKKARPLKKSKTKETRSGNPNADLGDMGELDDTLASLRKKLKCPKRSERIVYTSGGIDGDASMIAHLKSSRRDSNNNDTRLGRRICENTEGTSDEVLENSFSDFLQRSGSGSVTRVCSIKKKDRRVEITHGNLALGLQNAEKVLDDIKVERNVESPSVEDRELCSSCTVLVKNTSTKKRGRKTSELREVVGNNDTHKTRGKKSASIIKRRMGSLTFEDGSGCKPKIYVKSHLDEVSQASGKDIHGLDNCLKHCSSLKPSVTSSHVVVPAFVQSDKVRDQLDLTGDLLNSSVDGMMKLDNDMRISNGECCSINHNEHGISVGLTSSAVIRKERNESSFNDSSQPFRDVPASISADQYVKEMSLDDALLSYESSKDVASMQDGITEKPSTESHMVGISKTLVCNDVSYEADGGLESLHEQSLFGNASTIDNYTSVKTKKETDAHSEADNETVDGSTTAVAAGLKAFAVSPIEKIKFKDILKRKGGLQEYLDCRNLILGLWGKSVNYILQPEECVISETPSVNGSLNTSLVREIFKFLDGNGYINTGIALEKARAPAPYHDLCEKTVPKERDTVDLVLDVEDAKCRTLPKPSLVSDSFPDFTAECLESTRVPGDLCDTSLVGVKENIMLAENCTNGFPLTHNFNLKENSNIKPKSDIRRRIIVVGAGPAGLTAARHLQRQGFDVAVLEARDRIGGRVYTDRSSLSVPVDLGASIITGVEVDVATERRPDPSSLVCKQLGLELSVLNSDCPLYDIVNGEKVPSDLDQALEAEYNSLLDDMVVLVEQTGEAAMQMSLEEGLEYALRRRRMAQRSASDATQYNHLNGLQEVDSVDMSMTSVDSGVTVHHDINLDGGNVMSPLERRVMDWHFANLEYGCAAALDKVSLPCWNQDDVYGGFGGAHCMIKGGYSAVMESLGDGLNIYLNHRVDELMYHNEDPYGEDEVHKAVKVITSNGGEFLGDAVLITVPLGCLKAKTIKFSPDLPQWKSDAIERLGFGVLNKVVLEFSEAFWDDTVDYFGVTAEETHIRGQCFMFWNVKKTVGAPVLIALVVGRAALNGKNYCGSNLVMHAMMVLRKLFGESSVPDPIASVVTNWGMDPFSKGAYSYVAVGASGEDYDILGRPVANCLFFAGEATCKEHPDTVGGAMISGIREAVRILDILTTGKDYAAEIDAMEAVQNHSVDERNEARDLSKSIDACNLSNIHENSLDVKHEIITKETLLKDMFSSARTTSGRLYLAKELLRLPVNELKSIAGTKEGLVILNSWICDSLGKNATQLLRHCVRLLVLVSTDLLAVRSSGVGRTVKEKVCMHTSRDIRAVASQLVNVWIDILRKEKASNGGVKFLKQMTGKPSLGSDNGAKGFLEVSCSMGSQSPSKENHKDLDNSSLPSRIIIGSKDKVVISEEEAAAFAAVEAARAAELAAAKAYASSEAKCSVLPELPKIPSFHKFLRREQYGQMDEFEFRTKFSGVTTGSRQDCMFEMDSRNCRVRDWPVDFNIRERSEESVAIDSRFLRAWVDTDAIGNGGVKDSLAIERWQSQAMCADAEFFNSMPVWDEEDSNKVSKWPTAGNKKGSNASSSSHGVMKKPAIEGQLRGAQHIKQGVVDYVASLLMPLYKARKLDKDGYKTIMKKAATKVMELCSESEKLMTVFDFLDYKRKNKIRSFVDKLIERHMAMSPNMKS